MLGFEADCYTLTEPPAAEALDETLVGSRWDWTAEERLDSDLEAAQLNFVHAARKNNVLVFRTLRRTLTRTCPLLKARTALQPKSRRLPEA